MTRSPLPLLGIYIYKVAPAFYEGVPEFLESVKEGLSELAVYSSLYMALVSTAGFTGFKPTLNWYYMHINGVYCSMMLHTAVVVLAVFHRIGAIGHLRDSDKLLVRTYACKRADMESVVGMPIHVNHQLTPFPYVCIYSSFGGPATYRC